MYDRGFGAAAMGGGDLADQLVRGQRFPVQPQGAGVTRGEVAPLLLRGLPRAGSRRGPGLATALTLAGCGGPGTGTPGDATSATTSAQDTRPVTSSTARARSRPSAAGETNAAGERAPDAKTADPSPSAPADLPGLGPRTLAEIPDNARQVVVVTGQDKNSRALRLRDGRGPGTRVPAVSG